MDQVNQNSYCIIMAGGIGNRFWPVSNRRNPKQFSDILHTGKSFIRQTYERIAAIFPADRIYTIYNGIDFKTPISTVPKEEYLRSLGVDYREGDVVAGIAARLNPVKDYPTLLRAMKLAIAKNPHLRLVAAGDGEDLETLTKLAEALGIKDRVCFAGWVKDMNSFYHAIDINLLTSLSETFPYALTEGARMHRATMPPG